MKIENYKLKTIKGFSLVELLVVITIIAILSVVAYTAVGGQTGKARNSRRQQDLSTIQSALEIFYIENMNKYPDELDDGAAGSLNDLVPKYMPKMALDPATDAEYDYEVTGNNKKYQLGASLEDEETPNGYTAYIIGNSETDMIDGVESDDMVTPCNDIADGSETCVPYAL
jgi:prepilin-type N-terminal cleavage/methylation domain-containing protein